MDIGTPARYELAQRLAEQPGAIFVDRDGTINEMVPQEHVTTREQFRFIPGALDALAILAQKSEAPIVIWTNQPAIGRGEATQEQGDDLHDWMVEQIVAAGGQYNDVSTVLGFIAVLAATINVVGGFLITDRMLKMFKRKK